MGTTCDACGEPLVGPAATTRFCEACGHELTPAPEPTAPTAPTAPVTERVACSACSHGTLGLDGFCDECGHRPAGAEHLEELLALPSTVPGAVLHGAGVTDRGHRRRRNEDAFALARAYGPGADDDDAGVVVAVVCDGVASVPGGATASRTACDVAVAAGCDAITGGADLDTAAATAADAARRAVAALAPGEGQAPACTYVAAVADAEHAVISWVGDSRAYWLGPGTGTSAVLTEDDSWAAEMVAAGLVAAEDALSDPRAHVITRWLAADAPDVVARRHRWSLDEGGVLLLCSDGVWNHLPDPDVLAGVLATEHVGPTDVHDAARALVGAALDDGGHDNATAIVLALGAGGSR